MNKIFGYGTPFVNHLFDSELLPTFLQTVRTKVRKASSIKRNPKKSKGQHYSLKFNDGQYVRKSWVLATQPRLRYHGGLNVAMTSHFTLMSLAEGKVVITCEKADLNFDHSWNKKYYSGLENSVIYKKYVHVVPKELPQRFKVIEQV